jgi:hypothetical protein
MVAARANVVPDAGNWLQALAASKWQLAQLATYIFLAVSAVRYTGGVYAWMTENRLEQPAFTVVKQLGDGVEVRKYEAYNVAEATLKSSFKEATSSGFRLCAGYLFGKNQQRARGLLPFGRRQTPPDDAVGEKMEMTAPVRQTLAPRGARSVKVSFVMSRKRALSSLPLPRDTQVKLRAVPAHYAAFKRFNGRPPSSEVIAKKEAIVRKAIDETAGAVRASPNAETLVYGYHDPFLVPNLLRRNEVGVKVEGPALPPLRS